jgi:hypothetical protein
MSETKKVQKCCLECGTKLGLFGFGCKCSRDQTFCASCRFPKFRPSDSAGHKCSIDYIQQGKDQIAKANPKVAAPKVDVI